LRVDGTLVPNAALTIEPQVHKGNQSGHEGLQRGDRDLLDRHPVSVGSKHTNSVEFADSSGARQTNTWVWSSDYPHLAADAACPSAA